ncbi:hypothetical protein K461DRAFT_26807 [Myriangium duriaei CBS 260.36]|uniref:Uncharacterized protein n=1 Tax=Myriangium duriaei CBS 260.36 TaxID=1168546 RepID=A0A9P4JFJ2_9PEZI|nr:hypothetical protein K461DRAFT_26807 [Myriangium duriaei CBS 260.36]
MCPLILVHGASISFHEPATGLKLSKCHEIKCQKRESIITFETHLHGHQNLLVCAERVTSCYHCYPTSPPPLPQIHSNGPMPLSLISPSSADQNNRPAAHQTTTKQCQPAAYHARTAVTPRATPQQRRDQ